MRILQWFIQEERFTSKRFWLVALGRFFNIDQNFKQTGRVGYLKLYIRTDYFRTSFCVHIDFSNQR